MTTDSVVTFENFSHVSFITLNNPQKGNVVNNDNLTLLFDYINQSILDINCRIIVIQGKDGVFCRGMDFSNLIKNFDIEITKEFSQPYKDVVKLIHDSPKPVIASIDGDVLAGGMGIMLACDIIIATERSVFGLSEVLFGIIPAYVFPFLIERVPFKKARFLILSSKRFDSKEAYELGLIDERVENDKLEKKLKDYIKRLLYSSPSALATVKKYSDHLINYNLDKYLDIAQDQLTTLLKNNENIEAIKLFLEGEKPKWAVGFKK